jgi:hypothetical protein
MLFAFVAGSIFTVLLMAYFFPYLVALGMGHGKMSLHLIAAVNLLFGWCFVGWVAAIIMAFSTRVERGRAKVGRIIFMLVLLAILGYLSAFEVGKVFAGLATRFDAVMTGQEQVAMDRKASYDNVHDAVHLRRDEMEALDSHRDIILLPASGTK